MLATLKIQQLDEAIILYPNWPEAVFNRGVARIHLKRFEASVGDFDRAEHL